LRKIKTNIRIGEQLIEDWSKLYQEITIAHGRHLVLRSIRSSSVFFLDDGSTVLTAKDGTRELYFLLGDEADFINFCS
jgi:hypothetical protein